MEESVSRRDSRGQRLAAAAAVLLLPFAATSPAAETLKPNRIELAPGVYQFISPDVAGNVDGNSIAVVTDRDVLMFDSTLLPNSARAVLTELRQVTIKPVRYLVNSHWHPDHTGGNDFYARSFPDLEIIAHRDTRQFMQNTGSVYLKTLRFEAAQASRSISKSIETERDENGKALSADEIRELQSQLALEDRFLTDYQSAPRRLPTLIFNDTLTLFHAGREFRLMHLPGHTAGDIALYLPDSSILLTGDLLAYPVPYCADSHPAAWIASLETLVRLDAGTIVPGHGQARHDGSYLLLVLNSLRQVQRQVHEALRGGLTLEQTQKAINLEEVRRQFTHDDPELNAIFDGNFTPIVRQMYDEATEGLEQYQ